MDYQTFFDNLNKIKDFRSEEEKKDLLFGFNPIIIFQDLHWGNILSLLELNGYTLHGGSITRRHKLSIVQYRLSQFLSLSNLCLYKSEFYFQYVDKIFSSNKYDTNFYKHLIESNNKNEFNHIN